MAELDKTLSGGLSPETPGEITNPIEQLQGELADIQGEGADSLSQLNKELMSIGSDEQAPVARQVPERPGTLQTFFATLGGQLSGSNLMAQAIENTLRRGEINNEQAKAENEAANLGFENEQREKRFNLASLINQRMLDQQVRSGELKEAAATLKAQDKLERDRLKEQEDLGRESTRLRIREQMKADLQLIEARGESKRTTSEFESDLKELENAWGVPREVAQLMDNLSQGATRAANAEISSKGGFALLEPGESMRIFARFYNFAVQNQARIARMFRAGQLDPANPPADLVQVGATRKSSGTTTSETTSGSGPNALSPEDIAEIERLGTE